MIINMKEYRFVTLILLVLLLGSGRAMAQENIQVHLSGGAAWNCGSRFGDTRANGTNATQPSLGTRVTIGVLPLLRVGLGYDYSRMLGEQLMGTPDPLTGTVYKDLKTYFHALSATAEYNVLTQIDGLSLYVGSGFGCLFATGHTWELSVQNEWDADEWTSTVTMEGHNRKQGYAAPFIPVSASLEYRISPRTALCLGNLYRLVLSKNESAPKVQAFLTLGLRLDF